MTLSWAGIGRGDDPRYPSPERLADQLAALREAGYRTIRPADAAAFLAGRAPLPERALLLMFEGGRKDSFIRATPLLQKNGFTATLCVPTYFTEKWGNFHLKKPELRQGARLPQWSLASMGHQAFDEVVTDAEGHKGHFLSRRQWNGAGPEDDAAFRQRIEHDYRHSAEVLSAAAGRPIEAYLIPRRRGAGAGADPAAAELNRAALTNHYTLAFVGAEDPFNGPHSDPFDLSRLRVPGDWTGAQLVRELEKYLPRANPINGFNDPDQWLFFRMVMVSANDMKLGRTRPPGCAAAKIGPTPKSPPGQRASGAVVGVYARYAGPHAYVRVTLEPAGVRVQERLKPGCKPWRGKRWKTPAGMSRELKLRARGNRVWAWLDGEQIAGPLPLDGRHRVRSRRAPQRLAA
jgi:peptidoglycan/xylan/chitin deacetylase (PgdA/CDA1 family)